MSPEPVLVLAHVDDSGATLVKYSELSTESGLRVRAGGAGHGWRDRVDSGAAHLRDVGLYRLTRSFFIYPIYREGVFSNTGLGASLE